MSSIDTALTRLYPKMEWNVLIQYDSVMELQLDVFLNPNIERLIKKTSPHITFPRPLIQHYYVELLIPHPYPDIDDVRDRIIERIDENEIPYIEKFKNTTTVIQLPLQFAIPDETIIKVFNEIESFYANYTFKPPLPSLRYLNSSKTNQNTQVFTI